ncbi:mCG1049262 [Mus musculus]|nr:mCG1049262 [Mus musculus]
MGRVRVSPSTATGPSPYLSPSPRRSSARLCASVSAMRLARVPCKTRSLSPGLPAVWEVRPSVARGPIFCRDSNCTCK